MTKEENAVINTPTVVVCPNPDCTFIGDMPFDGICPECYTILD